MDAISGTQIAFGNVDNAAACGTACNAEPTCELWTYYEPDFTSETQRNKCFLKNLVAVEFAIPNVISGVKGCV